MAGSGGFGRFFRRGGRGRAPTKPVSPEEKALAELQQIIDFADGQLDTKEVMADTEYAGQLKQAIIKAKQAALRLALEIDTEEPYSGDLEMEPPADVIAECEEIARPLEALLAVSLPRSTTAVVASTNPFDALTDAGAADDKELDDAASEGYHSIDVPVPRATIHKEILRLIQKRYWIEQDSKHTNAFIVMQPENEGLAEEEPQVIGLLELHEPDPKKATSTLLTTKFKPKQPNVFYENAKLMLSTVAPIIEKDAARHDEYTFTSGIRNKEQARQVLLAYIAVYFDKMDQSLCDWRTVSARDNRDIFTETNAYITFKPDNKAKNALALFLKDDKMPLATEELTTIKGTIISIEELTHLKSLLAIHFGVGMSISADLGPNQTMCAQKDVKPRHARP